MINKNVFQKIVDNIEPLKTQYLIEFLHDNLSNKKDRKFSDIFHKNIPPKLPYPSLFPEAMVPYGVYCDLDELFRDLFIYMKLEILNPQNNMIIYIRMTAIAKLGALSNDRIVEYMYYKSKIYAKDAGNYVEIGIISEKILKYICQI